MKKIYTYWCQGKNFGDELNKYILEKYLSRKCIYASPEVAQVLGIGSIMEILWYEEINSFCYLPPIRVFSSGFHGDEVMLHELKRKVKMYAVRGYRSLERLKQNSGINVDNVVVADGGLLAGRLKKDWGGVKNYTLGIVPHYADKNNPIFKELNEKIESSIVLDVEEEPLKFIRELSECERIISTAMHPLIVSDSLRIPNMWVQIQGEANSTYKFEDYYSAFGLENKAVNLEELDSEAILDMIDERYSIDDTMIENKISELESALYRLSCDIERDNLLGFINKVVFAKTKWNNGFEKR